MISQIIVQVRIRSAFGLTVSEKEKKKKTYMPITTSATGLQANGLVVYLGGSVTETPDVMAEIIRRRRVRE